MERSRGLSIPEVLVACLILSLLVGTITYTFRSGVTASFKSAGRNDVLQQLTIAVRSLKRDLQQSCMDSTSVGPSSLAFLTHYDDLGAPQISPEGRPLWASYLVYYRDSTARTLARRRVNLTPSAFQRQFPTGIELFDPGTGPQALSTYLSEGRLIASSLENFQAVPEPVNRRYLDLTLEFLRLGEGNKSDSRADFEVRVYPKN